MEARHSFSSAQQMLRDLVAIDSVNPDHGGHPMAEAEYGSYVVDRCRQVSIDCQRLPVPQRADNILVLLECAPGRPWLLFCSHMDTVSAAEMTVEPFTPTLRGHRLYGRGSCDTKASGAAMFEALNRYKAEPERPNNVAVLYSVDEESRKAGVVAVCQNKFAATGLADVEIAGVVVGEPTELRAAVAHCGCIRSVIHTHGVEAHSSNPTLGKSAIAAMAELIQRLEAPYQTVLCDRLHDLCGHAHFSINTIQGGTGVNIIPGHCQVEFDRRVLPDEDMDDAHQELLAFIAERCQDLDYTIDAPDVFDYPLSNDRDARFFADLANLLQEHALAPEPMGVLFGSEASNFARIGLPSVVWGPGSIAQAHQADEWIDIRQVDQAETLYLNLMKRPLTGEQVDG